MIVDALYPFDIPIDSIKTQMETIYQSGNKPHVVKKDVIETLTILMERYFNAITVDGEILVYNRKDKIYVEGEAIICLALRRAHPSGTSYPRLTNSMVSEIINSIKQSNYQPRDVLNPPYIIPFANKKLDIRDWTISDITPEDMLTRKLPVKYNHEAYPEVFASFIQDITANETDRDLLIEMMSYCLYPSYHIPKAFLLLGGGANGKTTLTNVLTTILGSDNVSATTLSDLQNNRFALGELYGKMANISGELASKTISETQFLKMLTGGDMLKADVKFKQPVSFRNTAKLIFSANQLPEILEDSNAIWRRILLIRFPNQFIGDDCDPNILDKLTTPEELSGILNILLFYLFRLLERKDFCVKTDIASIRERYIAHSDSTSVFIKNCLVENPSVWISSSSLYQRYIEFCKKNNLKQDNIRWFARKLPRHISCRNERRLVQNFKTRGWRGIQFLEPETELIKSGDVQVINDFDEDSIIATNI